MTTACLDCFHDEDLELLDDSPSGSPSTRQLQFPALSLLSSLPLPPGSSAATTTNAAPNSSSPQHVRQQSTASSSDSTNSSAPAEPNNNNTPSTTASSTQQQQQSPATPTTPEGVAVAAAAAAPPSSFVRGYFFKETPWAALHARPTSLTILISSCIFLPVALLLQHHVLDATSHMAVFFGGSLLLFVCYYVVHFALSRLSSSFARLSRDKQLYAVSNLLKASVLASIAPLAAYEIYRILVHDEWNDMTLKNLGCLYSVPDFVSLVMVKRMAATTVVHHVCVVCFNFYSIFRNDYREESVCRLIVVYAAFAIFSYCVPLLLASRFLSMPVSTSRHLAAGTLVVYVACCGLNWSWQASYLKRLLLSSDKDHNLSVLIYVVVIAFVMFDDLKLSAWLVRSMRSSAQHATQQPQSVLMREFPSASPSSCSNDSKNKAAPQRIEESKEKKPVQVENEDETNDENQDNIVTDSDNRPQPRMAAIRVAKRRGASASAAAAQA